MRKFIFSLLFIMCVATSLYAQEDEQQSQFFIFNDFSKGYNSHLSHYKLPKNQAETAQNVRINDTHGNIKKRNTLISYGIPVASKITSLHRYYKSDNTKYLLATGSTEMYVGDDDDGTFKTILTGLTDSRRGQWTTYQDIAIWVNGADTNIKYDGNTNNTSNTDGHRTDENMVAELGAPFADLDTGTDLSASSWYQYKVVHKDAPTIYYNNAKSNAINTGAAVYNVELTGIPLGIAGTDLRRIYRTEAQSAKGDLATATFKLLTTIDDNSTRTFTDTIRDGLLGEDWSASGTNVTPLTGSFVNIHDERIFVAGNTDNKSDVYWSNQLRPGFFLRTDFEKIRPDDGDEITFIQNLNGVFTIGKTNSISKMYTENGMGNRVVQSPYSPNIGCPAPYSASVTPIGLIFLGRYGLYTTNGQTVKLISDAVTEDIRDIKQSNIEECFGILWNNEYHLAYTSDTSGESDNNRVLVFDVIRDAYVLDTKNANCMATLESGTDFGALYFGSSGDDGNITSDGSSVTILLNRYKSELDDGTIDDMRTFGTEVAPTMKLAWDLTWGAAWEALGYDIMDDMTTQLYTREDTDGSWVSPIFEIDANLLDKIHWNETLNSTGDITARIRTATESGTIAVQSWSVNYTDPSGSDISANTARDFIQVAFDLSTSDLSITPEMFVSDDFMWQVTYSKEGTDFETAIRSIWSSGWRELNIPGYETLIKRIRIFYQGTAGEFTFNYKNIEGDVDNSITIDASVVPVPSDPPTDSLGGKYLGDNVNKVYTYFPEVEGTHWWFDIADNGIDQYEIEKVEILAWPVELNI